jgi:hypothetical protein
MVLMEDFFTMHISPISRVSKKSEGNLMIVNHNKEKTRTKWNEWEQKMGIKKGYLIQCIFKQWQNLPQNMVYKQITQQKVKQIEQQSSGKGESFEFSNYKQNVK